MVNKQQRRRRRTGLTESETGFRNRFQIRKSNGVFPLNLKPDSVNRIQQLGENKTRAAGTGGRSIERPGATERGGGGPTPFRAT